LTQNTIDTIVIKRLKWHKTEVILVWLIIVLVIIPIPTGIGIFFHINNLNITQYVRSLPAEDIVTSQIRLLTHFGRGLGVVFVLVDIATIALARNRLSLTKDAYRMATVIQGRTKEE